MSTKKEEKKQKKKEMTAAANLNSPHGCLDKREQLTRPGFANSAFGKRSQDEQESMATGTCRSMKSYRDSHFDG
jgi:hypothetical protein